MIPTIITFSAVVLGVTALASSDPIVIHKTTVPVSVEFQGYEGKLVSKLLRDRIRRIARETGTASDLASALSYFAENESGLITLADQLQIGGVLGALQELSNTHTYSMDVNIIDRGNDLKLSIKGETVTGELFYISVDGSRDVPTLIDAMAERFIERTNPYVLALYHFRKEYPSGNFQKSLPLIKHSVAVLPLDLKPWGLFLWGRLLYREGDYDGAILKYQDALKINPDFAFAIARWGEALLATGDAEGGLAKLREAVSKPDARNYPAIYEMLGDTLVHFGRHEEAHEVYVTGLSYEPSNVGLQVSLAALYIRHGQFREAEKLLGEAILERQDPRTAKLLSQAIAGLIAPDPVSLENSVAPLLNEAEAQMKGKSE